jgi:tricorn protease
MPEKLPVPYGEFGSISPDGKSLAYIPISVDFRTWKRYRGGMNPAIWLFNLETMASKNLTGNDAANSQPMWHGTTLYFLSDRDKNKRANIWAYDTKKEKFRQVTFFEEFDIHFPAIGEEEIVFENGGRLFLLDLQTEKPREVDVKVLTDRSTLKPRLEDVSKYIHKSTVSPGGKRVALEARGDLFTVPLHLRAGRCDHMNGSDTLHLFRGAGVNRGHSGMSMRAEYIDRVEHVLHLEIGTVLRAA